MGENDRALDLLEEAYAQKDMMLRDLLVDPSWDSLRSEGRFAKMVGTVAPFGTHGRSCVMQRRLR